MGLFDKFGEIIDSWLGIDDSWKGSKPRYTHKSSIKQLSKENKKIGDGKALTRSLYSQLTSNWDGQPSRGRKNWRNTQNLWISDNSESTEITLHRTFMKSVNDEHWANEVPVASGVANTKADSVDFVFRAGREYSLIELKWPGPESPKENPLKASIQVLRYGLAYIFSRLKYKDLGYNTANLPILSGEIIHLQVLAPVHFYQPYVGGENPWLKQLEKALDNGVGDLAAKNDFAMTFGFEQFPSSFTWKPDDRLDECNARNVLNAFEDRHRLFQL